MLYFSIHNVITETNRFTLTNFIQFATFSVCFNLKAPTALKFLSTCRFASNQDTNVNLIEIPVNKIKLKATPIHLQIKILFDFELGSNKFGILNEVLCDFSFPVSVGFLVLHLRHGS